MEIQPVETAFTPEYPDKYEKEAQQTLAKSLPRRWISAPLAVGLLSAALALGTSGCGEEGPFTFTTLGVPLQVPSGLRSLPLDERIIPPGLVIPLFEYGAGTGSIGCDSVASPVFMSEEEAFAILAATFAEAGLTLSSTDITLKNVSIPATNPRRARGNLSVDGVLELGEGIPVEFVSTKDVENWQVSLSLGSTVQTYDLIGAARTLAENNPGLVVFYDPAVYFSAYSNGFIHDQREAREQAEALLREQALAFIDWLTINGTP